MADIIKALEAKQNENIPALRSGDNVSVHVKIKEGDRERIQEFKGTVIRSRKGGNDQSITVRRMASNGIGVERTFLLRSPRIENAGLSPAGAVNASSQRSGSPVATIPSRQ